MALRQMSNDIYDVSAWVDEQLGMVGSPERMAHEEKAWEEYQARILVDARKEAKITQSELARRIGADKSYISRIERGLTIPTMPAFFPDFVNVSPKNHLRIEERCVGVVSSTLSWRLSACFVAE